MKETGKNKYLTIFLSTLRISACTFGGGWVIIPLLRKRFAEELGWIDEQEMMDLTAIAQCTPGSIAINASILVGYHAGRIPGALVAVLGSVLPPLVIISVISLFYQAFRDNPIVSIAMAGMLCGVAAVILDVVVTMAWKILRQKKLLPILLMLAAFAAVRWLSVNVILVILACAVIGIAEALLRARAGKETL